jgi:hypothetical protein
MGTRQSRWLARDGFDVVDSGFDLDALMHPARVFEHPGEVVRDPDLTLNEKRAILASWASDACAVESAPALRSPAGGPLVMFDAVMDALSALDKIARKAPGKPKPSNRRAPSDGGVAGGAGRHQ